MIPYGKHDISGDDIDAVVDVLENHFLTQGSKVPEFEQALCDYTSAQFCTAVNSATSGLHVACLAAGVTHGDIVWTTPNSFVASANCALYCSAQIDFVDMDEHTRNIDIIKLGTKLALAKQAGQLPKALVVVHFAGFSCDMQAIANLLSGLGIVLIEDAAHGLGGSYKGRKIGSCEYSDITVLSFHPVKSITTAEGGAVLTNNPELAQEIVLFAKHGITRDHGLFDAETTKISLAGDWYYQQLTLGYNYRLSDMQAALGISQLKKLDDFILARQQKATFYIQALANLPLILPQRTSIDNQSAWHIFVVELKPQGGDTNRGQTRKAVYQQLVEKGIGVNVHYIPIHLHPFYQQLGFVYGDFPYAERYYERAITLPLYPSLTEQQQQAVVDALTEILV
ncbi:UDP-4-amino-4,6-dideoxy-N-acetyl-beta-L-altrosamine transaminase [Brumicola pallidula]|uniref:Spore coat polysaccharide biosynthesis protein spsC n=1 Tax=Brumicola pallidula DSM 14239 = ACAM 615 TaxID=1121922 RepID=K6Y2X1_9ALTE|nr:UDP-4-amino-4,6-dideoxy-N-acetyl-beta-L-altrosamine transaminase [Glaciecola pallidula]GAC27164.1 spore coat polysaccharide biosynthesis protein spsC [Glaciecola pallidula DSM 14239 = ACAM 615]